MHTHVYQLQQPSCSAAAHQDDRSRGGKSYSSVMQRMIEDDKGDKEGEKKQPGKFWSLVNVLKQEIYNAFSYGDNLSDISVATGFSVSLIHRMLADPNPDEQLVDEFIKLLRRSYKYSYETNPLTALVPSYLIHDLPESDDAKVDEIFRRINQFPFTYSGKSGDALTAFLKKSGDCSDLAEMFIYATKAAGINGVKMESYFGRMLVNRGYIHGRTDNCNTIGGEFWFFYDHFWCSYNGKHYDLLFRHQSYPQMHPVIRTETYCDIPFNIFTNGRCYIQGELLQKLGISLPPGKNGYVAHSLEKLMIFIDKCLEGHVKSTPNVKSNSNNPGNNNNNNTGNNNNTTA